MSKTRVMGLRELVAVLYVVGALVFAGGLVWAYWSTGRRVRRFDSIAEWSRQAPGPDWMKWSEDWIGPDDGAAVRRAEERRLVDDERARRLREVGIRGEVTWGELEIPAEFWSRRAALHDERRSFLSGGSVALF